MLPIFAVGRQAGSLVAADRVAVLAADIRADADVEQALVTCPAARETEVFVEVYIHSAGLYYQRIVLPSLFVAISV